MRQSTDHVLMITPTAFRSNVEAQADNVFMDKTAGENVGDAIVRTHQAWVDLLRSKGITVQLFDHPPETPDACFPNNWFCSAPGGVLTYFPMKVTNRRLERCQTSKSG